MDIYSAIQPLKNYLSNTREFLELKAARQFINQNMKLNVLITKFKEKQVSMYKKQLTQSELQKLMEEVEREYQQLLMIPELKTYFIAIDNFNILMSNVIKELNNSLETNL